jgi:hypothetical protein
VIGERVTLDDFNSIPAALENEPESVHVDEQEIDPDVLESMAAEVGANGNGNGNGNGHFYDRVTSRRVDLVQRIRDGIPAAEYLPASDGMLRRGKRHYTPAPKKVGKSITSLVHSVDMVLAGARCVVFDRENGGDLYATRLQAIIHARGLDQEQQETIRAGLAYFEFPKLRAGDESELVALCADADLVIFDSQRMYLSDLGLDENSSNDYATFMAALVEPLFEAGIATQILDNAGHAEAKRGRGTSSKGDLNEILFTLETVEKFDLETAGRVRLEIDDSRFGNTGRWEMAIGGGVFGSWERADVADAEGPVGFRPTSLMERASRYLESCDEPQSRRTVTAAIGGKAAFARLAIDVLVRERYARGKAPQPVESIKPYREADDPVKNPSDEAECVPGCVPENDVECVPSASPQEPLNHAAFEGASQRVPIASQGASNDCVPRSGFPYGEHPSASPAQNGSASPSESDDDIPF